MDEKIIKNMSTYELAEIVINGFSSVDRRFDAILEDVLKPLLMEISIMQKEIGSINSRIEELERKTGVAIK